MRADELIRLSRAVFLVGDADDPVSQSGLRHAAERAGALVKDSKGRWTISREMCATFRAELKRSGYLIPPQPRYGRAAAA